MPANEDSRDGANRSEQLAELRSDVRHLQADVTELKTEVRAINQRIDVLGEKLDKKIDELRDKGNEKMTDLLLRVEGVSKSVGSAKPWAVLLFFSMVGSLLYVIAHGLQWL